MLAQAISPNTLRNWEQGRSKMPDWLPAIMDKIDEKTGIWGARAEEAVAAALPVTLRGLAEANLDMLAPANIVKRGRVNVATIKLFRRMQRLGIDIVLNQRDAERVVACESLPGPVSEAMTADAISHRKTRQEQREAKAEKQAKKKKRA